MPADLGYSRGAMGPAARTVVDSVGDLARRVSDFGAGAPPYAALHEGYARLGLEPGSAVMIFAPNGVEFLFHWIAILANGLVPCAVAPSTRSPLAAALCKSLGIAALVGPQLDPARYEGDREARIGSFAAIVRDGIAPPYAPYEVLMLTTGTSGAQTACVHSLEALAWNAGMTNETLGIGSADRQLIVLPMFHTYGLVTQSLGSILAGCELRIDGPPFNAARFARRLEEERISVCGITPTLARDLLARGTRLPRLRSLSIGGDRLSADEVGRLLATGAIDELYSTYGLTEAGPRVSVLAAHAAPASAWDSVGRPFRGISIRIDAPDPDGAGQLLVRTPSACRRKVGPGVAAQPFTEDGYLRTGDLFTQDSSGYLRYVARRDDILIVKGEKLNLRNIDRAAEAHLDVEFARTGRGEGDTLVTRLWAKDGKALDLDRIRAFLGASLRLHELPDSLVQQSGDDFHK